MTLTDSSGLLLRSQITKNASSAVRPWAAPRRHWSVRNEVTESFRVTHSRSSFASEVVHVVEVRMDSVRKLTRRRTIK